MSKYKAGDKFIIEIEDVLTVESGNYKTKDTEYVMKTMNYTTLDGNDLDYLDRYDARNVWNAGYKTGYDKGYQDGSEVWKEKEIDNAFNANDAGYEQGMTDAWECARKIRCSLSEEERVAMFGTVLSKGVFEKYTASEAIEKLREYEAKKDEIKVGDEVIDGNEILFVVTEVHMETATVMNCVGHSYQLWKSGLKKTGRHFPIEDILEQMRSE